MGVDILALSSKGVMRTACDTSIGLCRSVSLMLCTLHSQLYARSLTTGGSTKIPTNRYEDYVPPSQKRFSGAARKSTALWPSSVHEAGRGPRARIIDLDSLSVEASISPTKTGSTAQGTYTGIASCGMRQHGTTRQGEYPEAERPERNSLDGTLSGQTWAGSTGQTPGWVKEQKGVIFWPKSMQKDTIKEGMRG